MNIKKLAKKYELIKDRINSYSGLQITQTYDKSEIIADGCRRIVSCDENIVIFEQLHKRIIVTGQSLKLRNWGVNGVAVVGLVQSVEFVVLNKG
ncbi:MAG: hypothetical protein FWF76_08120 [Oscillospiraceae bacterium]|nr:hypothetical protein [Oscillospiraceae bacterium]